MVTDHGLDFSARFAGDGVVQVQGDVDIVSAVLLEQELRQAAAQTKGDLVVDLEQVGFIDSAGMNVLVRIFKVLDSEARSLVLTNTSGSVRRALEVGGASVFADLR